MEILFRPLNPDSDFPRMAELISLVEPEPINAATLQERESKRADQEIRQRLAAVTEEGMFVGFSDVFRVPWMTAGRFGINVLVDPAYRHRGIGTRLLRVAHEFAQAEGGMSFEAEVRDHLPNSRRFAQQHGFREDRHIFESTLLLDTFDAARFVGIVDQVRESGIRFFTMADVGDSDESLRKLYDINRITYYDVPGFEGEWAPFEEFRKWVSRSSWYRPDGQIIAAAGEEWVGVAAVRHMIDSNSMYNLMTGVDRRYRSRKIALALKLLAIEWARRYETRYIRTNNDSKNAPMLAINRKLGYRPEPGFFRMVRDLARSSDRVAPA